MIWHMTYVEVYNVLLWHYNINIKYNVIMILLSYYYYDSIIQHTQKSRTIIQQSKNCFNSWTIQATMILLGLGSTIGWPVASLHSSLCMFSLAFPWNYTATTLWPQCFDTQLLHANRRPHTLPKCSKF